MKGNKHGRSDNEPSSSDISSKVRRTESKGAKHGDVHSSHSPDGKDQAESQLGGAGNAEQLGQSGHSSRSSNSNTSAPDPRKSDEDDADGDGQDVDAMPAMSDHSTESASLESSESASDPVETPYPGYLYPDTLDDFKPENVWKLGLSFEALAVDQKHQGDKLVRDPEQEHSVLERGLLYHTDSLLLYVYAYVCADRNQGSTNIEDWKGLLPLIEKVRRLARKIKIEFAWGLCCYVESVVAQRIAEAERALWLKAMKPSADVATQNPDSSSSSSDSNIASYATPEKFYEISILEDRAQNLWLQGSEMLSSTWLERYLPDTFKQSLSMPSRVGIDDWFLPHRPRLFCWPLNPYDAAIDLVCFGRKALEEWASQRWEMDLPAVPISYKSGLAEEVEDADLVEEEPEDGSATPESVPSGDSGQRNEGEAEDEALGEGYEQDAEGSDDEDAEGSEDDL